MFIQIKRSGYTRDGQQFASGLFLILMQPENSPEYPQYLKTCADCGRPENLHDTTTRVPQCEQHGVMARLKARIARQQEPADADFNEEVIKTCPACVEFADATARLGCRYFRLSFVSYPLRAIVRHVAMSQCGHFMMGFARVHGTRLTLSGSYGSDGLPDTVPAKVYDRGIELPAELYEAWKNGGGWNSAGSESAAMRQWAKQNLATLRA